MSSTTYAQGDSRTLGMWSVCHQAASRTSCYMEECMGRDQWAGQRSAGSIMSETTAKSWVSLWRKQINWRGTGRGGGVVSQGCLNAQTCLCRRSNKSSKSSPLPNRKPVEMTSHQISHTGRAWQAQCETSSQSKHRL